MRFCVDGESSGVCVVGTESGATLPKPPAAFPWLVTAFLFGVFDEESANGETTPMLLANSASEHHELMFLMVW